MKKIEKVIRGWRKFPGKSGPTANSYLATISKATGNPLKNEDLFNSSGVNYKLPMNYIL